MSQIKDYILSILHLRTGYEAGFNAIITLLTFIAGYFGGLVFDNYNLFMAVAVVVFADNIVGQLVAICAVPNSWQVKKAMKVVWYLGAYWGILAMVLSIEKGFPSAFFLSEAIIMPILLFQSVSILKNMSLLGVLPKGLLLEILQKIDGYKNKPND